MQYPVLRLLLNVDNSVDFLQQNIDIFSHNSKGFGFLNMGLIPLHTSVSILGTT